VASESRELHLRFRPGRAHRRRDSRLAVRSGKGVWSPAKSCREKEAPEVIGAVLAHAPKGEHEAEAAARDRRLLVSDDHDARRRVMGELARDAAEQEALEA
jgi:hypothetical protein